jgi:hypothetical protein
MNPILSLLPRVFNRTVTPAPAAKALFDPTRRFFIFGAAATLIIPPPKTFHFITQEIIRPAGLILPGGKLFDLPDWESMMLGTKLSNGKYKLKDVPRWIVLDKAWYDEMVRRDA